MWHYHDPPDEEEDLSESRKQRPPCTPTQLAASTGDLVALRMLLDHGANVNESPGGSVLGGPLFRPLVSWTQALVKWRL